MLLLQSMPAVSHAAVASHRSRYCVQRARAAYANALEPDATASKFIGLMAAEERPTDFELESNAAASAEWYPTSNADFKYGKDELIAQVIDPAVGGVPRQMHLVKGLLTAWEIDRLRMQFIEMGSFGAASDAHARVLVENGRVVCHELHALLAAPLEDRILPYVRMRLGEPRVVIADALVRAYREEDRRLALAPHFDTSSFATIIVPLNPGQYEGGLYIQPGASASSRVFVDRSFEAGDALMHRFDVTHGVEVTAGNRYSLVLWLSDSAQSMAQGTTPWLRAAADAGNAYAQYLYGDVCRQGAYGVGRDDDAAVDYFHKAANQGHALAQFHLGMLYWGGGSGVEQSDERCVELWRAAATAGLAAAQVKLGMCYASGYRGLQRDDAEARRWFERAARQGHIEAVMVLRRGGPPYEL